MLDTCSLGWVHERRGKEESVRLLKQLDHYVAAGELVFPPQVADELEDYQSQSKAFYPKEWAKRHKAVACAHGPDLNTLKRMWKDFPQVQQVLDHRKPRGKDEADPYILALGLELKQAGHEVTVVTEDRNDKVGIKLSVVTACGYLRLVCLPMHALLEVLSVK